MFEWNIASGFVPFQVTRELSLTSPGGDYVYSLASQDSVIGPEQITTPGEMEIVQDGTSAVGPSESTFILGFTITEHVEYKLSAEISTIRSSF